MSETLKPFACASCGRDVVHDDNAIYKLLAPEGWPKGEPPPANVREARIAGWRFGAICSDCQLED